MTDAMFEVPSRQDITSLVIDEAYAQRKLSKTKLRRLKAA
jgi:hypothetical protein